MSRIWWLAVVSVLGLALSQGCGATPVTAVPSGTPARRDAGADAATVTDAADTDAGVDAGEGLDAGARADAAAVDGGAGQDAASQLYLRYASDGGPIDGSFPACFGQAWPIEGENHVPEPQRITYQHLPPSSGNHWFCWAAWKLPANPLPPERFIHNLEHGAVVLLYRCPAPDGGFPDGAFAVDGGGPCPAEAAQLASFVAQAPVDPTLSRSRYLISPQEKLPTKFAAVAWGWTLERDVLDVAEFNCFSTTHLAQSPENFAGDPDPIGCPQSY